VFVEHFMLSDGRWIRVTAVVLFGLAVVAGIATIRFRVRAAVGALSLAASAPQQGRSGGYVSSSSCRACHPGEYASWHNTYHRTMTQYAGFESIQAPWNGVSLVADDTSVRLDRSGDRFFVDIVDPDWLSQHEPGSGAPRVQRQVDLVTGSHHMQVYWIPSAAGNKQYSLPFTYLLEDRRWVPRADTFLIAPGVSPASFERHVWNANCLQCHATAGQPRATLQSLDTRVGEIGIACEACHGPGEQHINLNQNPWRRYYLHLTGGPDPSIVNPIRQAAGRSSQICGQCHSVKWIPDMKRFLKDGFAYRPGDDLEDTVTTIRAVKASTMSSIRAILDRDPDFGDQHFWRDGMVRVSGREYNGMIESPCAADNRFSCLSCHSMHNSDPNYQVSPDAKSNTACLTCHKQFAGERLVAHTHHPAASAGSQCVNCHMPYTAYGLLRALRSHQIDSPSVDTSLRTGRPDACNLCHLDKTLGWTADRLKSWYSVTTDLPNTNPPQESAALQWMISGDAGQRALIAWSMGWAPAQEASGTDWMAPFLGILLEDPYAAVRYIAYHSIMRLPGWNGFSYDFIGSPETMASARETLISRWQRTQVRPNAPLLINPGGKLQLDEIRMLLKQRNDRRIFLDE